MRAIPFALVMVVSTASAAPNAPPPAPAIAPGTRTFVAFAGSAAAVRLVWQPIPNVARYRARWVDAGAQIDIELPGTASAFERNERTPGRHTLSVVAIDATGRESPATEIAVEVIAVHAIAAGAKDADADGSAFAIGARFSSPGLACRLGNDPPAPEVIATQVGAKVLVCGGEPGQPRVEVPVVIAPVQVVGPTAPITRGQTTRVHVTVASVAPIGDHLVVEAIGDVGFGDAERTERGLWLPITVREDAKLAGLIVRAGALELGRAELALADAPAPPPPPETRSEWFALDVGGQFGGFFPPSTGTGSSALGNPRDAGDAITTGLLGGGRIGVFPTRRVGLEGEAALVMAGYSARPGTAALAIARTQLAVRMIDEPILGLRLLAGVDLVGVLTERGTSQRDAMWGVHYGAAFTVETRRDLWFRFEALHLVTSAVDAGYAHCVEVQLGVVTRLGRRDRW